MAEDKGRSRKGVGEAAYQQSTLGKIDRTVNPRRHGASAEPEWKPVKEMGKDGNHHGEATQPAI